MNREEKIGRYIRLFGNIFFSFVCLLLSLVAIFFLIKYLFGFLDSFSFTEVFFRSVMILAPGIFFLAVVTYYWKRTRKISSTITKYVSFVIFAVMFVAWIYAMISDMMIFSKHGYDDIKRYFSFSLTMIVGSIGLIFLVGMIQALAEPEEEDWLDAIEKKERKFTIPDL
jgi:hypothetical protein